MFNMMLNGVLQVLFGDTQPSVDNTGWYIGVGGIATGLLVAGGKILADLLSGRSKTRRVERADTILEWHNLAHELQERYDRLTDRNDKMQDQMREIQRNNSDCEKRAAEHLGEIRLLQSAVQRLQADGSTTLSGLGTVVTVTADLDGIIRTISPSVSSLLHWLPADLIRKNVELLIPERYRSQHTSALCSVKEGSTVPWTERTILAFALTGDKSPEVPVAITLTLWTTERGERLITADIKKRMLEERA